MEGTTMAAMSDKDSYALTITFSDVPHNMSAKAQFKNTYKVVLKILEESTEYSIYPEWRTTNNSIHYHGTIKIKDKIKWHKSTYRKLSRLGFIKIKKVDELKGWLKYCEKEKEVAESIIGIVMPMKNGSIKHIKEQIKVVNDTVLKYSVCSCIECLLNPVLSL